MPASKPVAILIMGMHRSGTSAVARVINLLGVDLGTKLMAPGYDNPSGFWENGDVVAIHESLLQALHMTWDDPRPLPADWMASEAARSAASAIRTLIGEQFAQSPLWAIKDPRLCRFIPLWRQVLQQLEIEPRTLIVSRNPLEVAQSLVKRNDLPEGVGQLLWTRYTLEAEEGSRGLARSLVDYQDLLADWASTVVRIGAELELALPIDASARAGIEAFLSQSQRHNYADEQTEPALIAPLFDALHEGADSSAALTRLAGARSDFEQNLQQFQPALSGLSEMLVSRNEELLQGQQEIQRLHADIETSKAWAASRDAELVKALAAHDALQGELATTGAWAASRQAELLRALEANEKLQGALAGSAARRAALDAQLAQKRRELDGLQHQVNLLSVRLAAVEERLFRAGLWNRARRFLGWGFRVAKRMAKAALFGAVRAWPGSAASKRARISRLREFDHVRRSGENSTSTLRDVHELAAGRWPARPAYLIRRSADFELPDIDISVVAYESEQWVDGFLTSLFESDYPLEKINLFVRDHSAGLSTRLALERFFAGRNSSFGTYNYSRGRNVGFGGGHNHNFKLGRAKHFLVCNIDGKFPTETLRTLMGAVATSAEAVAAWELRQAPYEHPKYYDPVTMLTTWVSGACVLFRRDAYQRVGGFDDLIFMYGEDVDLSYRLRGQGYQLAYVPLAVFRHDTYSEPGQFKALQFHGSTLANVLLRLRFGTLADVAAIPGMWRELGRSARQQGAYAGFVRNGFKLLLRGPLFLLTRSRRGHARIPFARWDYGLRREGAFEPMLPAPKSPPLVSIVVRTYRGREQLLQQALASIANQTYPHIEVLVVEDKGEQMRDTAETCAREFGLDLKFIPCHEPGSNRCMTGNIGLGAATGAYMNFLDDDDLFFSDHVEFLVSRLAAQPQLGACYSLSWETKIETDAQTGRYSEVMHSSLPGQRIAFDRSLLEVANYIPIHSVLFRRELFERYGGFNLQLDNLEDWNLWRRYSWRHDFLMCEKSTSLYHIPGDLSQQDARQSLLDRYYAEAKRESDAACELIDEQANRPKGENHG